MTLLIRFTRAASIAAAMLILVAGRDASAQTPAPANGCVSCHGSLPDARLSAPVKAFQGDVHQSRGFACTDCHGGNAASADKAAAHDAGHGYRGKPAGAQITATCARCHSDAAFMRNFAPRQRVDQATEYATSVHGIRLASGDQKVATCISCHHAHGIRAVSDALSPVFPTNVAATCSACHSNAEYMKGYTVEGGKPIPTNQRADYDRSVHHEAMVARNDLSAPTCNDCHGNHGAAPPGVGAVSNVCGTCHAVFATNFQKSVHAQIFDKACVECHSNHAVLQPSDEMLGTSPHAVCTSCHSDKDDPGFVAAVAMRADIDKLKGAIDRDSALIARVRNAGMEVGDQELALGEIHTKLTVARTQMHTFDPAAVHTVIAEGMQDLTGVEKAGNQALADLRFRRRGLFVSLVAILLMVVALTFKIRDLDRQRRERVDHTH